MISTASGSSSITLSWRPPSAGERNGDIVGYIINVTNLDSGLVQQFNTPLVPTFVVPNLDPFTVYVSTVSALTAVGMGPFSGVVSSQTLEDGTYTSFTYKVH